MTLNQSDYWLDVSAFRQHIAACKTHDHPAMEVCEVCVPLLEQAVTLYKADFMEGFRLPDSSTFDEWQFFLAEELRREQTFALEHLVKWYADHAFYERAISFARRWLALDVLHEPAHRSLMQLYAVSGQKSAALRQYQLCIHTLKEELNIAPTAETTALYNHIRYGIAAERNVIISTPEAELAQPNAPAPLNNLPAQLNSFIGRKKEIREILALLLRPDIRLLTLTGSGGTGKTRLSLVVAGQVLSAFKDGVFFIQLASLRDSSLVLDAIAQTFGLRSTADTKLSEVLERHLRDKHLLLVLDNFEHVIHAAPVVSALLTDLPKLKVLVTSRSLLHVTGEHTYPVLPMHLPDAEATLNLQTLAQNEVVHLFVDRAAGVKPDFTLTDENAHWVVEICTRLDGLPLAIELAAVRLRLLPLEGMLTQLEHRLPFLKGGPKDLPDRQRALRSTIAWSYTLLEADEQKLFRRLAVFAGGCTWEAAKAVSQLPGDPVLRRELEVDVLDSLEKLVDQSLLQQSDVQGTARFTMLETIREYALEHLYASAEADSVQQAHALFYLELAEASEYQLDGPEPELWMERLDWELDNLRAALTWALEHDHEMSLRMASALTRYWILQARLMEGHDWLAQVLAKSSTPDFNLNPLRAWVLRAACELAWHQGDSRTGIKYGEESVHIFQSLGNRHGLAYALMTLAQATFSFPDSNETLPLLEESLVLCRKLNDALVLMKALYIYGWKLDNLGKFELAHAAAEECYHLAEDTGAKDSLAAALWILGTIEYSQYHHTAAMLFCEKSLRLYQQIGNKTGERFALSRISVVLCSQGHYNRARQYARKTLALSLKTANKNCIAETVYLIGYIALLQGQLPEAKTRFKESLALLRETDLIDFTISGDLWGLVQLADIADQPERVAVLLGAVEKLRCKTFFWSSEFRQDIDRLSGALCQYLDEVSFNTAYNRGLAMTLEEAITFGLSEGGPE